MMWDCETYDAGSEHVCRGKIPLDALKFQTMMWDCETYDAGSEHVCRGKIPLDALKFQTMMWDCETYDAGSEHVCRGTSQYLEGKKISRGASHGAWSKSEDS